MFKMCDQHNETNILSSTEYYLTTYFYNELEKFATFEAQNVLLEQEFFSDVAQIFCGA